MSASPCIIKKEGRAGELPDHSDRHMTSAGSTIGPYVMTLVVSVSSCKTANISSCGWMAFNLAQHHTEPRYGWAGGTHIVMVGEKRTEEEAQVQGRRALTS
jgi:hypothetical protein